MGVVTTGLKLEDFVEYVDKPLQALYKTSTNCSVESRSEEIGNKSLTVSQHFEDRQQLLDSSTVSGMALTSIDNRSEEFDIDMLLLAASQQFELQSESHQPNVRQQGSVGDESTALAITDEVDDELLMAASQQFEDQLYSLQSGRPAEVTCKMKV